MTTRLNGRFYFKKTSNGNLVGEFSNNQPDYVIATESADLKKDGGGDYFGEYNTTWQENGKAVFGVLKISRHAENSRLFTLNWNISGESEFTGEGMLCDNILIGDYRNSDEA